MHVPRFARVMAPVVAACLVGLVAALTPLLANAHGASSHTTAQAAISTSCPAPGTARAASLPSLTLGSDSNIVYIVNEFSNNQPTFGTLKRYDTVTGNKVEVLKLANATMQEAQVSADGQWLLFVVLDSGQTKLELVRMDGQFQQTLYCGGPRDAQWSTDEKNIVFADGGNVLLLNTSTGTLQTELSAQKGIALNPRTWLDLTHVFVTFQLPDAPPQSVLILDITKGPNQNYQNLPVAFDASGSTPFCWDFDSSFDGKTLYTSQCNAIPSSSGPGQYTYQGPSVIAGRSPTNPLAYSYLYVSQSLAFSSVRAVTSSTLLFTVINNNSNTSQNGLWRVGTDGSHPAHLTPSGQLNSFSQFPWSNVSRDSSKYALLIISCSSNNTYTLEYGSLSGGTPTVFASITNVQLAVVGWTTM